MANAPIGSVSGLASGIQWQDMITQIMELETARQLDPLTLRQTTAQKTLDAWNAYSSVVAKLKTAADALRDGTPFGNVQITVPNSPTSSRTLLTATASPSAVPGSYSVGVLATASSQKLSGNVVTDATSALGVSGQFLVSGQAVTIGASDSLASVRDKINALNVGSTPTHVSASILMSGTNNARLVLSSDVGGSAGLDLRDARAASGSPSVLQQLGFFDGTASNIGADGVVRSASFSSTSAKITVLTAGVTGLPAATSILINGHAVSVDVQNQSLADIAAAINAVSPNSASVETVTDAGTTSYRLAVSGSVSGGASAQPTLELLGLVKGTTNVVKQEVRTTNGLQAADGSAVDGTTLLLGLKNAGGIGAAIGDSFTITGTKADGVTKVSLTETVDGTKTVDEMLADISTAFSAPGRHVTADLSGGRIRLTDDAGGDAGISFSIAANNESAVADPLTGSTLSFGATATDVAGRARELAQGTDARILINGVTLTRSSNTITDAIAGVTLSLQQAEVGTTIPVTIARDTSQTITAVQNLVATYNAAKAFVDQNAAAGGPLAFNGALRSSMNSIKNVLLADVVGLSAGSVYSSTALLGVAFDKTGKLQVDTAALTTALGKNPDAVKALFATNAVIAGTGFSYLVSGNNTRAGNYTLNVTHAATQSAATGTTTNFVYADGGATDTMTIADSVTGGSGSIQLSSGATVDSVVSSLNGLFTAQKMQMQASNVGGQLKISSTNYGATPNFTVSYATTGSSDVAGQIGIPAGTYTNGANAAGKFVLGGTEYDAVGVGQRLTGAAGTPVDGLAIQYAGSADVASASIDFANGIGGLIASLGDSITRTGDGIVAQQTRASQSVISRITARESSIQDRLDRQRASLIRQFTAMEKALSRLQSQGQFLTNQLNALQPSNK